MSQKPNPTAAPAGRPCPNLPSSYRLTGLIAFAAIALAGLAATVGARPHAATAAPSAALQIFFIDVEGGAATLIVSPAGESLLVDSGNPGDRDGARIAHVVREHARLTRIDHYVTTHWHRDHVGGIAELVRLVAVSRFYGHTIPDPLPPDIDKASMDAWRQLARNPVWLTAGDRVPLATPSSAPALNVEVVAANALVRGEPAGSSQIRTCDRGHEARAEDTTDNARSLGLRVSFGGFDLFAGGDLTWNVEHKLVCPRPLLGQVDAFLVDHHGLDASNNPALVRALRPTVAIVNNGPSKGAEPQTLRLLLDQVGPGRVFQLHRNVRDGAINTDGPLIANEAEACDAAFIRLTVTPDAKRYEVAVPAKDRTWSFDVS